MLGIHVACRFVAVKIRRIAFPWSAKAFVNLGEVGIRPGNPNRVFGHQGIIQAEISELLAALLVGKLEDNARQLPKNPTVIMAYLVLRGVEMRIQQLQSGHVMRHGLLGKVFQP